MQPADCSGRITAMSDRTDFIGFLQAIASHDHPAVLTLLAQAPSLATTSLGRSDEFFLAERLAQVYEGDSALHAAGFSYDTEMARALVAGGANPRARNRRGAEPLHAATIGDPASPTWCPEDQVSVITFLVDSGADPNAAAAGGVTPLHRAVRNRCSAAVEALLLAGADPHLPNSRGSTAYDLAALTTGRGGSGSAEAKSEQRVILDLLTPAHPGGVSHLK
jgi:hypothetical protein